jgi:hypothetical protein
VTVTCAAEGMHLRDGEDVLVADIAETFATAVLRLYGDEALWQRLAAGGRGRPRQRAALFLAGGRARDRAPGVLQRLRSRQPHAPPGMRPARGRDDPTRSGRVGSGRVGTILHAEAPWPLAARLDRSSRCRAG